MATTTAAGTHARILIQRDQHGPLEFADVSLPDPGPHQVLVKIQATGLCQSQIYWMHQARKAPVLFGHEGYGVATKVGAGVSGIREGDPVLVTWIPREDASGRLPEAATLELPDGSVARAPNCYTWADHALLDCLYVKPIHHRRHDPLYAVIGCAVMTGAGAVIHSAGLQKGQSVAIYGVGGVGLSAVAAARVAGASRIIAVDLDDQKLELARNFGATDGINSRRDDPATKIHELLPGHCGCSGTDFALDVVGLPSTTRQALASVRSGRLGVHRGGHCVVVGVPKEPVAIDTLDMMFKEKTLSGSLGGSSLQAHIDDYIDWCQDGHLDLEALITHRCSFDEIIDSARALEQGLIAGRAIALI